MTKTAKPLFALVDCNNFFVSCERLFRPDLEGAPVAVLSSNDGCAVARSNEAKALGIPMAAPVFKYRHLLDDRPMHTPNAAKMHSTKSDKIVKFSANFELYGDISRRITTILRSVTPKIEVYSVDESFLDLSQLDIPDLTQWGKMVRERILAWVGVPVSIGIAPSKTLAKLAVQRAKKTPKTGGVLDLATANTATINHYLQATPLQEIWGVGGRLAPKLRSVGVNNALDLSQLAPKHAQQLMGIHGRQMVSELNKTSCLPLHLASKPRQSIARTRTFGQDTNNANVVESALANFAAQAAFRLRQSNMLAKKVTIFVASNKHKPGYKTWSANLTFSTPTADTGQLISDIVKAFTGIYNKDIHYHRAGVLLYDFVPKTALQTDLLGTVNTQAHDLSLSRMKAVDNLNNRYGKRTVNYAAELLGKSWKPKYNLRSPRFVTRWDELQTCRAIK